MEPISTTVDKHGLLHLFAFYCVEFASKNPGSVNNVNGYRLKCIKCALCMVGQMKKFCREYLTELNKYERCPIAKSKKYIRRFGKQKKIKRHPADAKF
jgi:hypothetical protein